MSATDAAFHPKHYLAPRFWPTWLLFALLWLCSLLPLHIQLFLGRRVGDALYVLHKKRRHITTTNLRLCFPEQTPEERYSLLRETFRAFGMSLFEMASLWFRDADFLLQHCTFEGLEHLETAHRANTGIILLQAHFTSLELGGCLAATRVPLDANYDPPRNPLFAHFIRNRRERYLNKMIDNRSMRQMVRRLRKGACVWYSPDQHVAERNGGIRTQFFSQDVLTVGGASRMARMTGAVVIPFLSIRESHRCHYRLQFFPPLQDFPGDAAATDTQRINDIFEAQIRAYPAQYFWLHQRFKTHSSTAPDHYA